MPTVYLINKRDFTDTITVRFPNLQPNMKRLTADLLELQREISRRCPSATVSIMYRQRNPIDPRVPAVAVGLLITIGGSIMVGAGKKFGERLGNDLYDNTARFTKRFVKPPKRKKKPKRAKRLR